MTNASGDAAVAGVLLAAGLGTRFSDGNKLLARAERDRETAPVVRLSAQRLVAAPVTDTVAVLGHEADHIEATLAPVDIETVRNPAYDEGQASSVAHGVAWARNRNADAALFALGDMPWVAPSTYRALVERWRETDADIVVPEHDGQRGNPVLFGAAQFDALETVTGDTGGRALMQRNSVERVVIDDPGVHRDVDRVTDLR